MDELRLRELKEYRDQIIQKHIALISLSFFISITFSLIYFIILHGKSAINFLIIVSFLHSPLYLYILLSEKKPKKKYQYSMGTTLVLILCFSLSIILFTNTIYYQILLYFITLCIYHYAEFFSELFFHFKDLQKDAFLIYENKMWVISTLSSFAESIIGTFFFHKYKNNVIIFLVGLIMTIVGQYFRIAALFTGKTNFTHKIQYNKRKNHVLVKHGVYSICRHPSYFGFFIWSVGIEIMCENPICTVAFTYILFKFFKNRIQIEEKYLIKFFGFEYIKYRREVGILLPFINIDRETEKENLEIYLEDHEDEKEDKDIINFLNDKTEENKIKKNE